MITLELRGFEEAIELLQEPDIGKQLETTLEVVLQDLRVFAVANTPVKTGSMKDAWIWSVEGLTGRLFIDPAAINRVSGIPVSQYASVVDQRVGILDRVERQWDVVAIKAMEKEIGWDTPK